MKTMYRAIKIALEKGYYINEQGELIGPKGRLKINMGKGQKYPTFSVAGVQGIKNKYGVFGIPVHKFAGAYFYGLENTIKAECVRHLDGNVLNFRKENIALGTHKQNELDKVPEVRQKSAKLARAAQGSSPNNTILKENKVFEMLQSGHKQADIAREFGVSRTAVSNYIKRRTNASV